MRRSIAVLAAIVAVVGTGFTPVQDTQQQAISSAAGCSKSYTRGMFHAAARKVYTRGNWQVTAAEKRKIRRYVRCQRGGAKARHNVRGHLRRYKSAHTRRFYWEIQRAKVIGEVRAISYIAACESGGNPQAIGGGGAFRGKWQFTFDTWASVGGSGDPAAASEAEQDVRAVWLRRSRGTGPWPVCG